MKFHTMKYLKIAMICHFASVLAAILFSVNESEAMDDITVVKQ